MRDLTPVAALAKVSDQLSYKTDPLRFRRISREDLRMLRLGNPPRNFNYPEQSKIKTKADLETLGIKTFFCSNVCAAYNRKIFDELGGFVKHTINCYTPSLTPVLLVI